MYVNLNLFVNNALVAIKHAFEKFRIAVFYKHKALGVQHSSHLTKSMQIKHFFAITCEINAHFGRKKSVSKV